MTDPGSDDLSGILRSWKQGDPAAVDRLMPMVYEELKRLAHKYLRGEAPGHTLQTTALVHEAYLRLVGADMDWEGRKHFYAVAAKVMRRILVDHARTRGRAKRGGGRDPLRLDKMVATSPERPDEFLALDEALSRLSALDPRKARVVELLYFGGLNYDETGEVLGISAATVHRDLRMARAWLFRELKEEPDPGG